MTLYNQPQYPTTWGILPKLNWEILPVRSEASGSDVDDSQGDSRGSLEVIGLGKVIELGIYERIEIG